MTRQREEIRSALGDNAGFRSAQDLHAQLRRQGSRVGLTTVYRALQRMVDTGEVDVLRVEDGESRYRRCRSDTHHHHLVCRSCGGAVEVAGPVVERWAERVAAQHGFHDVSHTVEVFGTCADCRR